jgi:hypothetical protein
MINYHITSNQVYKNNKPFIFYKEAVMVFNTTFNNISVISWGSVLLVEEIRVPNDNHWTAASHWKTLCHNVVTHTPRYEWIIYYNRFWEKKFQDVWCDGTDISEDFDLEVHIQSVVLTLEQFHCYIYVWMFLFCCYCYIYVWMSLFCCYCYIYVWMFLFCCYCYIYVW